MIIEKWTPENELNADTVGISSWSTKEIIQYRMQELRRVYGELCKVTTKLSTAAVAITKRVEKGGRVITIGAGGSGVAGMSVMRELPQNHRMISPTKFTYRIAGGARVLEPWGCEELEDSEQEGEKDIVDLRVNNKDVVVCLSASGRTPYTLAAARKAKHLGAYTIAILCRANSELEAKVYLPIVLNIGSEMFIGATCEKAVTAEKVALDAIMDAVIVALKITDDNRCLVRVSHEKSRMLSQFLERK